MLTLIAIITIGVKVSKFRCSGACSIQTHMEQGLSLCPDKAPTKIN